MTNENKIQVLRSDESIRQNINNIPGVMSISEDTGTMKISQLLAKTCSNTEIEQIAEKSLETDVHHILKGVHADRLQKLAAAFTREVPDDTVIYSLAAAKKMKNNMILENNHVDSVRGNVIAVVPQDSTYRREFEHEDHLYIQETGKIPITNTHDQYKKFFLVTDGISCNRITNCFSGVDLSSGASLSFWVKYDSLRHMMDKQEQGLFAFVGDYEPHYFDEKSKENNEEYADYTTHLSVSTMFTAEYDEGFFNFYHKKQAYQEFWDENADNGVSRAVYRSDKAWMHVIVSFTDAGAEIYVNGVKVRYKTGSEIKGKRFNQDSEHDEYRLRTSITDFLSDEKTNLYMCLTLDETSDGTAAFFDDITFFDKCVENDDEAMEMFNVACGINLL